MATRATARLRQGQRWIVLGLVAVACSWLGLPALGFPALAWSAPWQRPAPAQQVSPLQRGSVVPSNVEQLPIPATIVAGQATAEIPQSTTQGTIARLRIPSELILDSLDRDFTQRTPVQRTVLGTDSRGHAICHGHVDGEFLSAEGSARLAINVAGTLTSHTRGVSGPAIIDSEAVTHYQATTIITFDGKAFVAQPSKVCGQTRLTITNVDSSLPRLRGRIVRRVAARRAVESQPQAQDITCQLTLNDLQKRIDEELNQRLLRLNSQFQERLSVLKLFKQTDTDVIISTSPAAVQLDLISLKPDAKTPAMPQLDSIGTGVELWLPVPPLAETPVGVVALSRLPELLGSMLDDQTQLSEFLTDQLRFRRHGDWLIVELENGE